MYHSYWLYHVNVSFGNVDGGGILRMYIHVCCLFGSLYKLVRTGRETFKQIQQMPLVSVLQHSCGTVFRTHYLHIITEEAMQTLDLDAKKLIVMNDMNSESKVKQKRKKKSKPNEAISGISRTAGYSVASMSFVGPRLCCDNHGPFVCPEISCRWQSVRGIHDAGRC